MILSDPRFRPWVERHLKATLPPDAVFIGQITDGEVMNAMAFYNYSGHDIHVSLVLKGRGTKRLIREFNRYVYGNCGCCRCTALIRPSNTRSVSLAERLGFKLEGVLRRHYGDEDAHVFGLLKEECRYEPEP